MYVTLTPPPRPSSHPRVAFAGLGEKHKGRFAAAAAAAKSVQSSPTLCDAIEGSPPGSPVPGILQARTLEWGAIAFSDVQTAKASRKQSSLSGKESAQGCIPKRLLGRPD